MNYLTHLQCGSCRQVQNADELHNLCPECGKPLLARYNLTAVRDTVDRERLREREHTMWRYAEVLPVSDARHALTLGEGCTPLILARRLATELGFRKLYIKDEGMNPTGSFKARGLSAAVSRAHELGVRALSIPSAGNAAGAMSAYAARAGMEAHVYMPSDVPQPFIAECKALGAHITLIDGVITDCARAAAVDNEKHDRFDVSTLKEPYRVEGKKTMGYEIAEQLDWQLPDVIIYPTGGGTGIVGMWKAFDEMERLGWIGAKRPRMVSVQAEGCAPIVRAFRAGAESAVPWMDAKTIADGLRVPAAVGDFLILRAIHASNGTAVAVSDEEMMDGCRLFGRTQGLFTSPESGATLAAFMRLRDKEWIEDDDSVVLFNTGSGYKYAHLFTDGDS
jgi:threonine synthase